MTILLLLVVNAILIGYVGPLYKFENCGYSSMIFEKQMCFKGCIDDYTIPFGTLVYASSLLLYCAFEYRNNILFYITSLLTLTSLCLYFYHIIETLD